MESTLAFARMMVAVVYILMISWSYLYVLQTAGRGLGRLYLDVAQCSITARLFLVRLISENSDGTPPDWSELTL